MAVITQIYDTYTIARRVADSVNNLGLAQVEASIAGNDTLRTQHETYVSSDAVPASGAATGAGIGAAIGGGAGLLAGLGMLAIPGLGPVVAAGWLASTALGLAGGAAAGGAVGALADIGVPEDDLPVYSEAVRRGGMLVTARFPENHRAAVIAVMDNQSGMSIEERRRTYRADGWEDETDEDIRKRESAMPTLM